MSMSPKEWVESIDHVITKPGRYGVFGLGISATVYAGIYFEYIEPSLFGGSIKSYTAFALAISAALSAFGMIFVFWKGISWLTRCVGSWIKNRAKTKQLLENTTLVSDYALAMLLLYLQQPNGRFQSPGRIDPFEQLITYHLIEEEIDHPMFAYVSYRQGTPFRVNPKIFKSKDKLISHITAHLSRSFSEDLSDPAMLLDIYREITGL